MNLRTQGPASREIVGRDRGCGRAETKARGDLQVIPAGGQEGKPFIGLLS